MATEHLGAAASASTELVRVTDVTGALSAFTGDVTKAAGGTALTIANDAVTYAKMQNVSATARLLGRNTAGAGNVEELTGAQAGGIIAPAWTNYTPTWTQGGTTISKTINYAKYVQIGKTVHVKVFLTATSAGTANNNIAVTLPVNAVETIGAVGSFRFNDNGTAFWVGCTQMSGLTSSVLFMSTNVTTWIGATGGGFSAAIASGDMIDFCATYEVA